MYSGPHIKKDGLVFGYDTGQFSESNPNFDKFKPGGVGNKRFFKGKPSINYAAHKNAVPQSSYTSYAATTSGTWVAKHPGSIRAYNAQGTDISYSSNSGVGDWTNTYHAYWTYDKKLKKPVIQMNAFDSNWKAKSFGVGMPAWSSLGVSAGDKYVISWLQWTTNTNLRADVGFYSRNTSNGRGFHDGRQSPRNTRTFKWERVHAVYTVSSNRNLDDSYGSIYMYGHTTSNGAGKILKIADVQLEVLTDHPSDYLDSKSTGITTSRSSTESLIDLAKTTNIDVSNVSFDSNGLPTFDGTDDYINLNSVSPLIAGGDFSLEAIIKGNTQDHKGIITINTSSGGNRALFLIRHASMGIYDGGTWYIGNIDVDNNEWHHVVLSYVRSTKKAIIYVDGNVSLNSTTNNMITVATNDRISIGQEWDGGSTSDHFNGQIPVAKIYNKAITLQEVKQNFKAYKNRFNI